MQIIAHRGASRYAPENTLEAFQLAFDWGARAIEFDVLMTADDVPVLMHDLYLDRTTNGHGLLSGYNWCFIKQLDAGAWFSKQYQGIAIPSLEQVLQWQEQYPCQLHIELKCATVTQIPRIIYQVCQILKKYNLLDRVLISSFQLKLLKAFHLACPDFQMAALSMECTEKTIQQAYDLGCRQLNISMKACKPEIIHRIHQMGMSVGVFTVNQKKYWEKYQQWGVDALFTDDLKIKL